MNPLRTLHNSTKPNKLVKLSSMATSFSLPSTLSNPNFTTSHHHHHNTSSLTSFSTLKLTNFPKSLFTPLQTPCRHTITASATTFHGLAYVVGDNIDTDQIIPAEYLTLVPSKPDEYEKLGSFALIGLPSTYQVRFVDQGEMIIIDKGTNLSVEKFTH